MTNNSGEMRFFPNKMHLRSILLVFIGLGLFDNGFGKGQDYLFPSQSNQGYRDDSFLPYQQQQQQRYVDPSEIIPFRRTQVGFPSQPPSSNGYHQSRDLQTSDLPVHLQHSLPQYRFTTSQPQLFNFPDANPFQQFSFQSQNSVQRPSSDPYGQNFQPKPTTVRPNYSHLFAKNHVRGDPSQTETFLGQITLQNPQEFEGFASSQGGYQQNPREGVGSNGFGNALEEGVVTPKRPDFLNHRTRIVAPDSDKKTTRPQVKDYFVNENGEVYSPTSTETHTTMSPSKAKSLSFDFSKDERSFLSKRQKSVDLDTLLEEPLKYSPGNNSDDEVEIVKSPVPEEDRQKIGKIVEEERANTSREGVEREGAYTSLPFDSTEYYSDSYESRDGANDIRENDYPEDGVGEFESREKEIDHLAEFNTSQESGTHARNKVEITNLPSPLTSHTKPTTQKHRHDNDQGDSDLVISVVTSKTVVNNTVIASADQWPPVTKPVTSTTESSMMVHENSTDTWVVVASVQTSRSVSGARYLPSPIVEQDVRVKLLNEHSHEDDEPYHLGEETTVEEREEESTTIIVPKHKTSTESLIDKLDRVQSDLSSGLLTGGLGNNIAVIKENPDKIDSTDMEDIKLTTPSTTKAPYPQVHIRKYSPANRRATTKKPRPQPSGAKKKVTQQRTSDLADIISTDYKLNASDVRSSKLLEDILNRAKLRKTDEEAVKRTEAARVESTTTVLMGSGLDISKLLPPGYKLPINNTEGGVEIIDDISKFLPSGYKPAKTEETTDSGILKHTRLDDISKFLPPGFEESDSGGKSTESSVLKHTKLDDISKFLPPGYKPPKNEEKSTESSVLKHTKLDDISKFLPPGYKPSNTTESSILKNTKVDDVSKFLPPGFKLSTESTLLKHTKADDVSKFLPPGYKVPKYKSYTTESSLFKNTKADDVSKFLPPGYKAPRTTTEKEEQADIIKDLNARPVDISAFLPPGYKPSEAPSNLLPLGVTTNSPNSDAAASTTVKHSGGSKVVFASRPGGGVRKSATRTTPKSQAVEAPRNTPPTIHKGWPSRATTEFTGWPMPPTTPISIEKLLEAARAAATTASSSVDTTVSAATTTTTTTTTTTSRPTTPGVCSDQCDLAATIKLVGGVEWEPELLDRNTKEWQVLANEVQSQLDYVYSSSSLLNKWYRKIRIDGFSEGSVLVDYVVELNDLARQINTQEIKKFFHESLDDALTTLGSSNREGKSLNESLKLEGKLSMGNFIVDPAFTDFSVLPKHEYPTVGYAENDVLLPQWAIAVIVIGLASLLFVIIFGVTVLVNRQKSSKKKNPAPLTEDMLNELNKNHMGGYDNYGAEDLYNMEDVWNERAYEQKPQKKRSSGGSIHDNSMSNLYDSWRSEWNGYYYNAYYGNQPNSGYNHPGSSHSGHNGRRRSDYDTNF